MAFELRALPLPQEKEPGFWFIFHKDTLLVEKKNDKVSIPFFDDISRLNVPLYNILYLGRLDLHPCFAVEYPNPDSCSENLSFTGLRQLFNVLEEDLFWLAARAYHLISWDKNSSFCGRCGEKTLPHETEHAKACPRCGMMTYPKISPAIIVAITKDDKILLAESNRFTSKFHSVLAGFVEPGENLEECVVREVMEEVGIRVKNIAYFGSQPWPFPDSLMLGFTAEYAGGEIHIDPTELSSADWFAADSLPEIPGPISIARRLIDNFKQKYV
jgi:NAD+ diphosphatase